MANQRSPKPRLGVRVPAPLPKPELNAPYSGGRRIY